MGEFEFGEDGSNERSTSSESDHSGSHPSESQTMGSIPHTLWTRTQPRRWVQTDTAKKAFNVLFDGVEVFDTPKPIGLLSRILQVSTLPTGNEIVLDFFAGAAPLAEAVFAQNAADTGSRRFIIVQLAEATNADSVAFKNGYQTISDIAKARIRRAGAKIRIRHRRCRPQPRHRLPRPQNRRVQHERRLLRPGRGRTSRPAGSP